MSKLLTLPSWLTRLGIFLLKGAGWAAIGIFVGFIVSYFVRLPGRVDTFSLTEALLGVVITGLSIVAAFIVALQWSILDNKITEFKREVKDTRDNIEFYTQYAQKVVKDTAKGLEEQIGVAKEMLDTIQSQSAKLETYSAEFKKTLEDVKPALERVDVDGLSTIMEGLHKIVDGHKGN
jgi:uncharacterized membrane protein YgaE (UPF0421/DUF939 family)